MEKHDYVLLIDRWIGTTHYAAGDPIRLTENAAKYLVLDGSIRLANPETGNDEAPAGGGE